MLRMTVGTNNSLLEELQFHLAKLGQGSLPRTAGAMNAGASVMREAWKGFAMGGTLPGISEPLKRPSGGYAKSIRVLQLGPFQYEIYSEAKIAELIETGTEELDMKTTHPYGPKSRVSKDGVPYLIIPFRWGTSQKSVGFKNIIPEPIYKIMKNKELFKRSTVRETTHNEKNFKGNDVARREYNWGDRMSKKEAQAIADDGQNYDNIDGMVAMDTGTDKKQYSGYFTFRIISANSPARSWIKPAMAARPVTKAVVEHTEKEIEELINNAIREDMNV